MSGFRANTTHYDVFRIPVAYVDTRYIMYNDARTRIRILRHVFYMSSRRHPKN